MARFLAAEAFSSPSDELSLLPFNFERTGTEQFLVSNMVGDFIRLTEDEINKLIDLKLKPGEGVCSSLDNGLPPEESATALSVAPSKPNVIPARGDATSYVCRDPTLRALVSLLPSFAPKHRPFTI
jgi:hypothetical protein